MIKDKVFKRILIISLLVIVIYLVATTIIVDSIYTQLQFNDHFDYESTISATDYNLVSKETDVKTSDGFNIHLYEVEVEEPQGVVIMLTGITGPSVTCFYGEAKLVSEAGFASVLVDTRGHGQSDGDKITFAIDDVKDVDAAVNYIKSQPQYDNLPIVVMGLSMGGATAINAGSLNDDIDGIIALSPFSSWTEVCIENAVMRGWPRWICEMLRPGILIHGVLNYGMNYFRIVPEETIKQIDDKPILIISSRHDNIVPISNHYRLLNAYNGDNLETLIREGDRHSVVEGDNIADPFDDVEYCNTILYFLKLFYENNAEGIL